MIALMMKNRPPQATKRSCLIVAPLALLNQWQLEIETKTALELDLRCLVYHGVCLLALILSPSLIRRSGPNKAKTLQQLQQYDIVLTTFQVRRCQYALGLTSDRFTDVSCRDAR